MSNEKMREEFDAWFQSDFNFETASMRFAMREVMFEAWQSSRAALCVELPSKINDQNDKWSNGYDLGIDDAQDALDAAGVRHK